MTPQTATLDAIFSALADPTRRAILAMLLEDDMAVTDVAAPFAVSLAAISKHLAVLAAAGLIRQERRGRIIWCKLEPDGLRSASIWMQGFGQFSVTSCRMVRNGSDLRPDAALKGRSRRV